MSFDISIDAAMATAANTTRGEMLREANYNVLMEFMPVIVFFGIMLFVGLIGNSCTIMFYATKAKKSSTFTFIIALAILDVIVCLLIVTTIADMCVNIYFTNYILCKFMYFFDHWIVVASVLVLGIISVDRYMKMCKPLDKQFTPKTALIAVLVLVPVALGSSVRDFVIMDSVKLNLTVSTGTVVGNYCTNSDNPSLQVVIAIVYSVDALMIASVFVTFLFTYGNIWRTLNKHKKKFETKMTKGNNNKSAEKIKTDIGKDCTSESNLSGDDTPAQSHSQPANAQSRNTLEVPSPKIKFSISDGKSTSSADSMQRNVSSISLCSSNRSSAVPKVAKKSNTERNVTIMMLAVSIAFVICFVPYFFVNIGIRLTTKTNEFELSAGVQFALRLPFLNSVINPIIFCIFNPQFRRYVRERLFSCKSTYIVSTSSTG